MAKKSKRRTESPVRYRAARADATVGGIVRRIERDYQLPPGSVQLVAPNRKRAYSNCRIRTLLRAWT